MRFYVAASVFFILGCLSIGGSIWAKLQIGRDIFYRTTEYGLLEFESYRYALLFQAKLAAMQILSKVGIWMGLFFLFGAFDFGYLLAGR